MKNISKLMHLRCIAMVIALAMTPSFVLPAAAAVAPELSGGTYYSAAAVDDGSNDSSDSSNSNDTTHLDGTDGYSSDADDDAYPDDNVDAVYISHIRDSGDNAYLDSSDTADYASGDNVVAVDSGNDNAALDVGSDTGYCDGFCIFCDEGYCDYPCPLCGEDYCDCCPFPPFLFIDFYTQGEDGDWVSGPYYTEEFEPGTPITADLIKELMAESGISAPRGFVLVDPFDFDYEVFCTCGSADVRVFVQATEPTLPIDDSDTAEDTGGKGVDVGADAGTGAGSSTTDTNRGATADSRRPATGPKTGDVAVNFMQFALAAALVATFAIAGLVHTREQS